LEQSRQLGEIDEPLRVPGRPIRVVPIDDPVDNVMRFRSFVEKGRNPLEIVCRDDSIMAAGSIDQPA